MFYVTGGVISFAAFFLYDVNSVIFRRKILQPLFAFGNLLLAVSTALCMAESFTGSIRVPFAILALAFFALLIYTLFFALPFGKTYVEQGSPPLCDRGMYALCRHPGVIWFCLMYASLALAWQAPIFSTFAAVCCLLNLAYVVFQDLWTFPKTFDTYADYRKSTPFLIPTPRSLSRAWQTRR